MARGGAFCGQLEEATQASRRCSLAFLSASALHDRYSHIIAG
jgi:hypothetical protein